MRNTYTKENLQQVVSSSISMAQVLRSFDLTYAGGNYCHIKKLIRRHNINTKHFLGMRTNSGLRHRGGVKKRTPEEILILRTDDRREKAKILRNALIAVGTPYKCICSIDGIWNEKSITLEVDHMNGNTSDDRKENLRFLCPNCHSQTDNYCGRNSR